MFSTSNALAEELLIKHHGNQDNTASQGENDNSPETELKASEDRDLTDRIQNSCQGENSVNYENSQEGNSMSQE